MGNNKKHLNFLRGYNYVKDYVINFGFKNEIEWQEKINFEEIRETDFLRESAWVILCAGMKESIVRKYFRDISFSFLEWESAEKIVNMKKYCIEYALKFFNNHRKIKAIAETAERVIDFEFEKLKIHLRKDPIVTLQTFPFMGPVTSYHLAKNLGLPVAKADRHLLRLSSSLSYVNVQDFCDVISRLSGDPIPVVDIVLWRFATLRKDYTKEFIWQASRDFVTV